MTLKIAIEGLNRVGKDTQLEILVDLYSKRGFKVLYMRGSGSRTGNGTKTFYDPESQYRKLLHKKLYQEKINTPKSDFLRLKATGRLQYEINQIIKEEESDLLFLNRNIITNHFMFKQQNRGTTLKQTLDKIKNASLGIDPINADLTIILHTKDPQLFIDRAKKTDDNGFREKLLIKHFHLYSEVLNDLDRSKFPYILIEANQSVDDISNYIKYHIDSRLEGINNITSVISNHQNLHCIP